MGKTNWHNRGQEDAAKGYGNYDPPHGLIQEIFGHEDLTENNRDYRDGYRNGVEQRKD